MYFENTKTSSKAVWTNFGSKNTNVAWTTFEVQAVEFIIPS